MEKVQWSLKLMGDVVEGEWMRKVQVPELVKAVTVEGKIDEKVLVELVKVAVKGSVVVFWQWYNLVIVVVAVESRQSGSIWS